jgi:hypothetical protein
MDRADVARSAAGLPYGVDVHGDVGLPYLNPSTVLISAAAKIKHLLGGPARAGGWNRVIPKW